MASLKNIKLKIKSVEKTGKVTKAMEAVSAAKMRKSQQRALAGRAYARAAVAILARVSGSRELANHPLTSGVETLAAKTVWPAAPGGGADRRSEDFFADSVSTKPVLYIIITSDKGLAGALNSGVLRAVWAEVKDNTANTRIIAVGRKANDFFVARGVKVEAYHPNNDDITSALVHDIVSEAAERFTENGVGTVKIAYQHFVSTFEQRPTIRTVFPLSLEELSAVVHDITPARGVFSDIAQQDENPATYTVEPGEAEVLDIIVPRLASIFVYHALLESQASEHSARMVAMKSASDKAGEMTDSLTLTFNKARQAAITREVSEIIGGMEVMAA